MGADHGGFELKHQLVGYLKELGHAVDDCGTHGKEPVDYPRVALAVAELVASGRCEFGVMVDGAGIGSAMTANKVPGVLAAACYNEELARNSREHNDANVLTLGAGQVTLEQAKRIVDVFLTTVCTVDRHLRRVEMIREIERGARALTTTGSPAPLSADDLARIADRVKQLLREDRGGGARAAGDPSRATRQADRPHAPEARGDRSPTSRRCATRRGATAFFSVCVNPTYVKQRPACCCADTPGEGVLRGWLPARRPAAGDQGARGATRHPRGRARDRHGDQHRRAKGQGRRRSCCKDIRGVVEACKDGRAICKVILETALLTDEEKMRGLPARA